MCGMVDELDDTVFPLLPILGPFEDDIFRAKENTTRAVFPVIIVVDAYFEQKVWSLLDKWNENSVGPRTNNSGCDDEVDVGCSAVMTSKFLGQTQSEQRTSRWRSR